MAQTAVAIPSFKRPDYLQRVLNSLAQQPDKGVVDWWLIQDGPVNPYSGERYATNEQVEACLDCWEAADLPNKHLDYEEANLGVAMARDRVFSLLESGYDRVIFLESDIVVGKHWLRLCRKLMDQFPGHLGRMYRLFNPAAHDMNPDNHLDEVHISDHGNHVNMCVTTTVWEQIRDDWTDYANIVAGYDFRQSYPKRVRDELAARFVPGLTGDDNAVSYITRKHDVYRVYPQVSRASDIGEEGYSHTPDAHTETMRGDEGQLTYSADVDIDQFEVVARNFMRGPYDTRL